MSTVDVARKTVMSLCLSAWMTCLPVLLASQTCTGCSAECEQLGCCTLKTLRYLSLSDQDDSRIASLALSDLPTRRTCSCECCRVRSVAVRSLQNRRQQTPQDGVQAIICLHAQSDDEWHSSLSRLTSGPTISERSLDRCVSLCRLVC